MNIARGLLDLDAFTLVEKCMSTAWVSERSRLVTDIDRGTIINWVKEKGEKLSDEPQDEEIPEITEIDELQTFVGRKKRCNPSEAIKPNGQDRSIACFAKHL